MNIFCHINNGALLVMYILSMTLWSATSFTSTIHHRTLIRTNNYNIRYTHLDVSKETEDAFSAFAESLDEDELFADSSSDSSSSDNNNGSFNDDNEMYTQKTWQESVEQLLDPMTPLAKRQILITDLLNSNDNIREDVLTALRERKVSIYFCNFYFFLVFSTFISLFITYNTSITNNNNCRLITCSLQLGKDFKVVLELLHVKLPQILSHP